MKLLVRTLLVISLLLSNHVFAADGPKPEEAKPSRPALPKFDEVTRDMKSMEGLFTLYYFPPEAIKKAVDQGQVIDEEKLLCQIAARMLGKRFMLSTSV